MKFGLGKLIGVDYLFNRTATSLRATGSRIFCAGLVCNDLESTNHSAYQYQYQPSL